MDKSVQVQVSYDEISVASLQDILKAETGKAKLNQDNYKEEVSSKLFLYRQDSLPEVSVHNPGDLVRLWTVGGEDCRGDISTDGVGDDNELKQGPKDEDNHFNMCQTNELPSKSSPTNSNPVLPRLTLIRGSSLSLVDIPTFLSSSVTLGTISTISNTFPPYDPRKSLAEKLAKCRANRSEPKMGKRSQWTVMCVALGFFSSCLILVGGMLSVTSDYQDRAIARMLNMSHIKYTTDKVSWIPSEK